MEHDTLVLYLALMFSTPVLVTDSGGSIATFLSWGFWEIRSGVCEKSLKGLRVESMA